MYFSSSNLVNYRLEIMRKGLFLFVCSFFCSVLAFSQQDPQFSQNMFNKLATNPGFTGSKQAICASTIHRSQWMGLEGAPTTLNLSVDAAIPMIYGGLGLNIMQDNLGPLSNLSINLSYSFQTQLGNGQLGTGISLGVFQGGFDPTDLTAATLGDPAIPTAAIEGSAFDLGIGMYYNTQDVYVGISSAHLTEPIINWESGSNQGMTLQRHYFLIAGYYYELTPTLSLNPSIYLKSDGKLGQQDFNTNVIYNNKIWGGVSYRRGELNLSGDVVLLTGMNITDDLKFSIAYDLVFTNISHNSLEFMLGYCFNIKYDQPVSKYKNPRFL